MGAHKVVGWISAVLQSPYWNSTAIFLTCDTTGGGTIMLLHPK